MQMCRNVFLRNLNGHPDVFQIAPGAGATGRGSIRHIEESELFAEVLLLFGSKRLMSRVIAASGPMLLWVSARTTSAKCGSRSMLAKITAAFVEM